MCCRTNILRSRELPKQETVQKERSRNDIILLQSLWNKKELFQTKLKKVKSRCLTEYLILMNRIKLFLSLC